MAFAVSAPGKVILFGEHSVVHNRPAVAAAVGLRSYLLVEDNKSEKVCLKLADLEFEREWAVKDLPFVKKDSTTPPTELDEELVAKVKALLSDVTNTFQHAAAAAFLYLYASICTPDTPGKKYTMRSFLPVGAGLGSSASYSVCVVSALLRLVQSNCGVELVNAWAFIGEKCIHGNPSGIDNAVATHGGAVYYQRDPAKLEPMAQFPPLKLLLTNTKVPRRTKQLVEGVGELCNRRSDIMTPILDAMGGVADATHQLLTSNVDATKLAGELAELTRINHGLLVSIGVSHPSLEKIKTTSDELGLGQTKLTGAGGGGCAVTIVTDNDHEKVVQFIDNIPEFNVFETLLGAPGAGWIDLGDSVDTAKFLQHGRDELEQLGKWVYW